MSESHADREPELIHLAGPPITFQSHLRQRCCWCGYVLLDVDLARIAVPVADAGRPLATYEPGGFYGVVDTGGFRGTRLIEPEPDTEPDSVKVPEGCCMLLPPELTVEP